MKLRVLGSSSAGNCYLLENEEECLVIEVGVPFKEVKKALDFNIMKINGLLCSHSHVDHSKYLQEYEVAGIQVIAPWRIGHKNDHLHDSRFTVRSFELVHDVPCYGFLIHHPDIGYLVFATDTEYIKYKFKDIDHIMVEANYSDKYIEQDNPKFRHVLEGHMSIKTCCKFLKANRSPKLKNVVLMHLSDESSNEAEFVEKAREVVGSEVNVIAADKWIEVEL